MVFNSVEYAAFLLAVTLCYWLLRRRAQNLLLLGASYVFYGFWDTRFLSLICLSTCVDYVSAQLMSQRRPPARRLWIPGLFLIGMTFVSVTLNLGALRSGSGPVLSFAGLRGLAPLLAGGMIGAQALAAQVSREWPDQRRRRLFMTFSALTNLGLLGCFKYFGFFADSASTLLAAVGIHVPRVELNIILPVGLSFYTFQTLSYTIDVYRREFEPADDMLDFAVFVAYFPQLIAGPIVRANKLLPQLAKSRLFTAAWLWSGLRLLLLGLLKKTAIADAVAGSVEAVFGAPAHATGADVAIATLLFSIQIVCDFSGYTDMARGSSRLLGIELTPNFDKPYLARNPQEFWRRWHITLSTWLRDYLYIPLGGSHGGTLKTYRNMMLTMLLGGLWHGAAWNFVLWGAFHGVALCVHRWARPAIAGLRVLATRAGAVFATAACYATVCYGWLLFRARSLGDIGLLTRALCRLPLSALHLSVPRPSAAFFLAFPALCALMLFESPQLEQRVWRFAAVRGATYAVMFVALFIAAGQDASPDFIYFQF